MSDAAPYQSACRVGEARISGASEARGHRCCATPVDGRRHPSTPRGILPRVNAVPLAPATVRPFVPHAALRDELGLPRDRFGAETASFARTHDGRHLVGAAGEHLVVLFADSGEVAWWAPVRGASLARGVTMLPDDVAVLSAGRELLGVAIATGATVFRVDNLGAEVTAVRAAPDDPRCLYVGGSRDLARLLDPYTRDTRWDLLTANPAWGEAREAPASPTSPSPTTAVGS